MLRGRTEEVVTGGVTPYTAERAVPERGFAEFLRRLAPIARESRRGEFFVELGFIDEERLWEITPPVGLSAVTIAAGGRADPRLDWTRPSRGEAKD